MPELSRRHFRPLDRQFARFLHRSVPDLPKEVLLAAALTSRAVGDGHICLDLAAVAGRPLDHAIAALRSLPPAKDGPGEDDETILPELDGWLALLGSDAAAGALVREEDEEAAVRPLVLRGRRLYLQRYHAYERDLARRLVERAAPDPDDEEGLPEPLRRRLFELFPESPLEDERFDGQRFAATLALRRGLLVVSGGPGTGKTTTVARILSLLVERQALLHPGSPLRILLAAPTGKAAARMGEAIRTAKLAPLEDADGRPDPGALRCDETTRAAIPETASTLHRLLGSRPASATFRHHRQNPLVADVVVVDEASMVALPLMAKLVDALPPSCKLILLGDMDQLASVEPGHVLGDLCAAGRVDAFTPTCIDGYEKLTGRRVPSPSERPAGSISDCFVKLHHSHRFEHDGPIDRLARAINACSDEVSATRALQVMQEVAARAPEILSLHDAGEDGSLTPELARLVRDAYLPFRKASDPAEALDALDRFRVLCALRSGPSGVETLNRRIEEILDLSPRGRHYDHRPVMIARNDYELGLFNGDVGVILHERRGDGPPQARAWFRGDDGELRSFAPPLLPEHHSCFAMTVHKSQGSEFDEILLLLPPHESPVVTKELVYTAITRARSRVVLSLAAENFAEALARNLRSTGGLKDRIEELTRA